jgi:type I restriction enzyme, S subunit
MNQDRSTTITNFQLKEGYKQTEVGIIPEDWSATNLGKFMMLQRGYDLPHRERKIGDIPIITSSGFGGTHSESRALAPGVVTGRYGTIGDVFYVQEDFWPLNTTLYVKNFYGNNPLFTSYLLKTIDFHSHSGKSGVPGVNRNDLHELIVRIPPLAEQEAIAYTLSDIDALIESLDRLLTKKRQIKQGAMQDLLSPYKEGSFKNGWSVKKLGELAFITKLAGFEYSNYFNSYNDGGEIIIIRGTNITNNKLDLSDVKNIPASTSNKLIRSKLFRNDLVFAYVGTIGPIWMVDENDRYHLGPNTCKIRAEKLILAEYLCMYFTSELIKEEIINSVSTGAQPSLSMTKIRGFQIYYPTNIEEQIEIANILSDMDAEIGSIESKLTKTRQLKQGIMHELLTGRIRLVNLQT